jgi:hypothetical protein
MKPKCTPLYENMKKLIIAGNSRFSNYFEQLENAIVKNPELSTEEVDLVYGQKSHVRKRAIKTCFFSGMLPDTYLYLTVTYGITTENEPVLIGAYIRPNIA